MNVYCDHPGSETSHGYTDNGNWIFYWVYDHNGKGLSFREYGYPTEHPVKPPQKVREATEKYVEAEVAH